MEINTNPNYLNNVQNQNAQGANSATAENVVEENLFDGNEANATQNNAVSQDYQNAEMLNTFVAAFTAVMAPFMQMMTQFMPTITTALTAKDNNQDNTTIKKQANLKQAELTTTDKKEALQESVNSAAYQSKSIESPGMLAPLANGESYIAGETNRNELKTYQNHKDFIESELAKFENYKTSKRVKCPTGATEYTSFMGIYPFDAIKAADTDNDGYLNSQEIDNLKKNTRFEDQFDGYTGVMTLMKLIQQGVIKELNQKVITQSV